MGFGRWFLRNPLPISLEKIPLSLYLSGSMVKILTISGMAISSSESLPHSTLTDPLWYFTSYACWKRTLGTPKPERRTEKSSWERSWWATVIDDTEMDREKPDRGQARGQLDAALFFKLKLYILSRAIQMLMSDVNGPKQNKTHPSGWHKCLPHCYCYTSPGSHWPHYGHCG